MARKPKITAPSMVGYNEKMRTTGVKVKNRATPTQIARGSGANNPNQARTSGGAITQGYDKEAKRFTKGTISTASGRMAEEGSTRAGGKTWTMTAKDENGNTIRQSGRSQEATRRQRYYDIRKGLGLSGG